MPTDDTFSAKSGNRLLGALPAHEYERLRPELEPIELGEHTASAVWENGQWRMVMWDDDDGLMHLGQYVRQRRKALGLTQAELGARLRWSQERVSVVERGTYGLPSLPQLVRLASALQAPISEMLSILGFGEYTPEPADGPAPHPHMRRLVERITMLQDGVLEVETRMRNAERQLADAASLCDAVRMKRKLMAELLSACQD